MALPLLLALPWIGVLLFVALAVRLPRELRHEPSGTLAAEGARPAPFVSIVVPARDEAHNIERVLRSLAASRYPGFEIVVVDDRSADDTAELARRVPPDRARRIAVIDGDELPEGWLGKPWACHQGALAARAANGQDRLLFTDADTVHHPDLLARSVSALVQDDADAVTVTGRQLMESFWERLVQPQIFMSMILRYRNLSRPIPRKRWRGAIANGQYILFTRDAYERLGGHERVKGDVVEDLRLAQHMVRDGYHLSIRRAEDHLATRMYRSLGELVSGWSKNLALGGLQTFRPLLRPFVAPAAFLFGFGLWIVPPLALLGSSAGLLAGATSVPVPAMGAVALASVLVWAAAAVALSVLFWCLATHRFRAPWYYGLLYPLGAAASSYIFIRSWLRLRAGTVTWKGRSYPATLGE